MKNELERRLKNNLVFSYLFFGVFIGFSILPSEANTLSSVNKRPEILILVDTSAEAHPYREKQIAEVQNQIISGFSGGLREGVTITIWTADKSVNTKSFGVYEWNKQSSVLIARKATEFLLKNQWDASGKWVDSLKVCFSVIKGSQHIKLVLNSSPGHYFQGSKLDHKVDSYLHKHGKKMSVFSIPVITTIVAENGEIIDLELSEPEEPIVLFTGIESLNDMVGTDVNKNDDTQDSSPKTKRVAELPFIMKGEEILSTPRPDPAASFHDSHASKISGTNSNSLPNISVEVINTKSQPLLESANGNQTNDVEATTVRAMEVSDNTNPAQPVNLEPEKNHESEVENLTRNNKPRIALIYIQSPQGLRLMLGVSSIIMSIGFLVFAIKFKRAAYPSLVSEAYSKTQKNSDNS